jgi:hypothetical protein
MHALDEVLADVDLDFRDSMSTMVPMPVRMEPPAAPVK